LNLGANILFPICEWKVVLKGFLSTSECVNIDFFMFAQGENCCIIYVHVLVAWMSLLIYIAMAISSMLFLLTKHPLF